MSKFIFQLESALRYRQGIEEKETGRLAQAMQTVQAEEEQANQLNLQKQENLNTYNSRKANLTTMQQQEAYLAWIDLRITKQLERLESASQNLAIQRSRVVEAATKRKSLETLKEKCQAEYRQVLSKAEQNMLDDVGIAAYCHKASN